MPAGGGPAMGTPSDCCADSAMAANSATALAAAGSADDSDADHGPRGNAADDAEEEDEKAEAAGDGDGGHDDDDEGPSAADDASCAQIAGPASADTTAAQQTEALCRLHLTAATAATEAAAIGDDRSDARTGSVPTDDVTAAMDALLEQCFWTALRSRLGDADLPVLASTFYAKYLLPSRPPGTSLDVRRSSYGKVGKFLRAMQQCGAIVVESDKGVDRIVAVDRQHDRYRGRRRRRQRRSTGRAHGPLNGCAQTSVRRCGERVAGAEGSAGCSVIRRRCSYSDRRCGGLVATDGVDDAAVRGSRCPLYRARSQAAPLYGRGRCSCRGRASATAGRRGSTRTE